MANHNRLPGPLSLEGSCAEIWKRVIQAFEHVLNRRFCPPADQEVTIVGDVATSRSHAPSKDNPSSVVNL
ncbi:hypothetical protein SK128_002962 [Halocaridina rubra]|uniref:Uncharacterized protein n=1 Tax=Halocaridina rubra TaxID=373956 RepID=A0AAN8WFT4_HALRR